MAGYPADLQAKLEGVLDPAERNRIIAGHMQVFNPEASVAAQPIAAEPLVAAPPAGAADPFQATEPLPQSIPDYLPAAPAPKPMNSLNLEDRLEQTSVLDLLGKGAQKATQWGRKTASKAGNAAISDLGNSLSVDVKAKEGLKAVQDLAGKKAEYAKTEADNLTDFDNAPAKIVFDPMPLGSQAQQGQPSGSASQSASIRFPSNPGDVGGLGDKKKGLEDNRTDYQEQAQNWINGSYPNDKELGLGQSAPGLEGASDALDGQILAGEYQRLADKPNKSLPEINRQNEIAQRLAVKTGQLKAREQAVAQDEQDKIRAAKMAKLEEQQNAIKAKVDQETNKLAEINKRYEGAEVDPNHFFKTWGDGGGQVAKTVMAAIAVAFGAYGAALTGGKNNAWEIINGGIQDDIKAQQMNIAKLGRAGEKQQNLVAALYKEYGDMDTAKAAADVMMTRQALRKMEQVAAKYTDRELADKAKIEISKGQAQLADKVQTFRGQIADREAKGLQVEAGLAQAENNQANREYMARVSAVNAANAPKRKGKMPDSKDTQPFATARVSIEGHLTDLGEFIQVEKNSSGAVSRYVWKSIPASDEKKLSKRLGRRLQQFIKEQSGAEVREEERKTLKSLLPAEDDSVEMMQYKTNLAIDFALEKARTHIYSAELQGRDTSLMQAQYDHMKSMKPSFRAAPKLSN